jgi:hypothetical protein
MGHDAVLHIDAGMHVIRISLDHLNIESDSPLFSDGSDKYPSQSICSNMRLMGVSVSPHISFKKHDLTDFFHHLIVLKRESLRWQITRGWMPTDKKIFCGVIDGTDLESIKDTLRLWRLHRQKGTPDPSSPIITSPLPRKRSELP